MSNKVTTLVYSRKAGSAHRKAVLAYMADRASDCGAGVWASKKTIADEIECGRSTVIKICNEFVLEGLIRVTGTRKCANGATIEYALCLDKIQALEVVKTSTSGTQTTSKPSTNLDTNVSLSPQAISQHFDDFWEAFPHRNGKKTKKDEAKGLFIKAVKSGVSVEEIARGVADMMRDPDVGRGFGRGPVPWLRQRGWTDEIPETQQFPDTNGGQNERPYNNRQDQRDQALADEILAAATAR